MFETLIIIFLLLHTIVAIKAKEWSILSVLGFKDDIPQLFLQKPKIVFVLRSLLLLSIVLASFGLAAVQWYIIFTIPFVLWIVADWSGRKMAFMKYRRTLTKMLANAETRQKKELYQAVSAITDQELSDIMKVCMQTGNLKSKSKTKSKGASSIVPSP